jgi:Starch-binding associating with outer membrane
MKSIMRKIIIAIFFTGVFLTSCNDRLEDLNKPTKAAVEVPAETLFTNGLNEMFYLMNNSSVNENVFRLYAQYWAQTTYPDESQYNMVGRRNPDNFFRRGFRDALQDLNDSRRLTEQDWEKLGLTEAERDNRLAIVDICKVYTYAVLVDAFGAVPYSESLNIDVLQPKYDDAQAVYNDLVTVLDAALASMDGASAGYSENQDPVYQGDAAKWKKFGNSLKLKMAITLADVDATKAGTMVTQAIAGGLFTSNDDNASITYLDAFPNTNPIHEDLVQSGRADYVVANTIIDKLKALADPRIEVFAEPAPDGTYDGGIYGTNNTSLRSHTSEMHSMILNWRVWC